MPGKKKKFIDKKNATTFVLAHRSQRDPLTADETAPQNVLVPLDQVPNSGHGPSSSNKSKDPKDRKEELLKYGIYFDDEYDYLQHLKDSKEVSNIEWDICERIYAPQPPKPQEDVAVQIVSKKDLKNVKLMLPSSVFESEFREDIGLLNKAATSRGPRPDLDPDVIAALDDDFDYENPNNELEDNFIELANQGEMEVIEGKPSKEDLEGLFSDEEADNQIQNQKHNHNRDFDSDNDYEDERADSLGSLRGGNYSDDDDENKSRFTSYSMSSSVVRRNKQLLLVDDCFEKMYEGYDDTEIGALDCDDIEGHINPDSDLLLKYAEEFEQDRKKEELVNEKITNLALRESDSDEDMSDSDDDEKVKEKWDCESILSTYSNIKNRPKIISEPSKRNIIKISGKTGMPVGVLGKGLTKHNLKELDDKYAAENNIPTSRARSMMSGATSVRSKTETTEERRERKKLVKEYRKERRLEKKANSEAFKDEKKRLEKVRLNDRHNIPSLKL